VETPISGANKLKTLFPTLKKQAKNRGSACKIPFQEGNTLPKSSIVPPKFPNITRKSVFPLKLTQQISQKRRTVAVADHVALSVGVWKRSRPWSRQAVSVGGDDYLNILTCFCG
jgi:hypothetical protein